MRSRMGLLADLRPKTHGGAGEARGSHNIRIWTDGRRPGGRCADRFSSAIKTCLQGTGRGVDHGGQGELRHVPVQLGARRRGGRDQTGVVWTSMEGEGCAIASGALRRARLGVMLRKSVFYP